MYLHNVLSLTNYIDYLQLNAGGNVLI